MDIVQVLREMFGVPQQRRQAIARNFGVPMARSQAINRDFGAPHTHQPVSRFNGACAICGASSDHKVHRGRVTGFDVPAERSAQIEREFGVPQGRAEAIEREFGPHSEF